MHELRRHTQPDITGLEPCTLGQVPLGDPQLVLQLIRNVGEVLARLRPLIAMRVQITMHHGTNTRPLTKPRRLKKVVDQRIHRIAGTHPRRHVTTENDGRIRRNTNVSGLGWCGRLSCGCLDPHFNAGRPLGMEETRRRPEPDVTWPESLIRWNIPLRYAEFVAEFIGDVGEVLFRL